MASAQTLTRPNHTPIIQVHSGRVLRSSTLLPIQLRFVPFRTTEKGRFRLKVAVVCAPSGVMWHSNHIEIYPDFSYF